MAGIFLPAGRRTWHADFTYRGRRYRPSLETENRAEAEHRLEKEIERVKAARWTDEAPGFSQAAERFVDDWLPGNVKPNTAKRYLVSLRQLTPFFERRKLAEIDLALILSYAKDRREQEATTATIRRDLNVLSMIFRNAIALGLAEANPVERLWSSRQLKEKARVIVPPLADDVDKLVAVASLVPGLLIRFLACSGMRLEEALSLEIGDVDRKRSEVRLDDTKTSVPRVVPLTGLLRPAMTVLAAAIADRRTGPVFVSPHGGRYTQFSSSFQAVRLRAGVTCRLHDLRHYFAHKFLRDGGDIYPLSKVLGHTSVKTTERHYARFATTDLHAAVNVKPRRQPKK